MENSMKNNDEIEIDLRQIFIVILSKIADEPVCVK